MSGPFEVGPGGGDGAGPKSSSSRAGGVFSDDVMRDVAAKAQRIGAQWVLESPTRIHSSAVAVDGSPEWHPDFARWLTRHIPPPALDDTAELRTTRVMRRLRKVAAREYEVCYRVLVLKDTIVSVTRWLNERARIHGIKPPPGRDVHYTEKDTLALFIAGIDWADVHW